MPRAAPFSIRRSLPDPVYFDLRVERIREHRFRAVVAGNQAETEFDAPFSPEELEEFRRLIEASGREIDRPDARRELERSQKPKDPEQRLKELGVQFFQKVFAEEVREAWIEKRGSKERSLALRLHLVHPELALWPWEYLREPKGPTFLALCPEVSLATYPVGPVNLRPLPVSGPFRILGVISNPSDCPGLEAETEWRALQAELAWLIKSRRVALELLASSTLDALNARLSDPRQPRCHALHFIGHGDFDREKGDGGLYFQDGKGWADRASAEELGNILAGRDLRLVVLNSCHGAQGDVADPFSSVAHHLVRRGVTAVVAMRYAVTDRCAVAFSRNFYRRLASGDSIDVAMAETRVALAAEKFKLEWGNPVLSLRSSKIFEVKPRWIEILLASFLVGLLAMALVLFWPSAEPKAKLVSEALPGSLQLKANPVHTNPPECPSPSGLDMEFVLIEPDTVPGVEQGEATSIPAEPFCMGRYEVTEGQWARLMGGRWSRKIKSTLPAGHKSAEDADRFVEKLNRQEKEEVYGLPSKIQWRFAARAGSTEKFSFGDSPEELSRYANCRDGSGTDVYIHAAPVGSFEPNGFGIYDAEGNVWEWVSDTEPPKKPGEAPRRIRVGGSWDIQPDGCYINREATSPSDSGRDDYGFRIVRKPLPVDPNNKAAQEPPQNR